jgi:hypothetical protein
MGVLKDVEAVFHACRVTYPAYMVAGIDLLVCHPARILQQERPDRRAG